MRTLDYDSVLHSVYEHFVVAGQPPGVIDDRVCYQAEMLNGLEFIARDIDLPPILAF